MVDLSKVFQSADWKQEKHVPVIELQGTIKKGEPITVTVSVGKEIPHPNTTEHYIGWITVNFFPDGEKFPYELGKFEYAAHGASVAGPNTSSIYTAPKTTFTFKTEKSGTLIAFSYCNIHGLWQNSLELKVK